MSSEALPQNASLGLVEPFPRRKPAQIVGAGVAQKSKATAALEQTLPKGITIGFRCDGRKKPWYVRIGATRKTESFENQADRNRRAIAVADVSRAEGAASLEYDSAKWKRLLQFEQRTGMSLAEAEEIVLRVKGNVRLELSTQEAIDRYLALRIEEGTPKDSLVHPRIHLLRFCAHTGPAGETMGTHSLIAIGADHVRTWLAILKAQGLGARTLRHHRKNLNVFFGRAVLEKWCLENPCRAVTPPKVADGTTPVLTAEEIFRLLKANRDIPIVGRLVLELFAGLRAASAQRLVATDIKWDKRGVLMRGAAVNDAGEWEQGHKSGKQHFRQRHPPVLWSWLEFCSPLPASPVGAASFRPIERRAYQQAKHDAFVRAGWDHVPHNRLRHCCATYLLAATNQPQQVARIMQHTSWRMLDRYEGIADEHHALLVLSMTPAATLLTWDEFTTRWRDFYVPFDC